MSKKKNQTVGSEKATAASMRKVIHRGHTAVQGTKSHHILIAKDGKTLHHIRADRAYTDAELKAAVDEYITMRQLYG